MKKRNKIILTTASLACFLALGVIFNNVSDPNAPKGPDTAQEKTIESKNETQKNPFGVLTEQAKTKTQKAKSSSILHWPICIQKAKARYRTSLLSAK